jgi:hypothetical protein
LRLKFVEEQNIHYSPPLRLLRAIHYHSTQIVAIFTLVSSSVSDDAIAWFDQVSVKLFRHLETVIGQAASDYSVREMLGQVTVFKNAVDRVNRFHSECTAFDAAVSEHGIWFYANSVRVCLLKLLDFVTIVDDVPSDPIGQLVLKCYAAMYRFHLSVECIHIKDKILPFSQAFCHQTQVFMRLMSQLNIPDSVTSQKIGILKRFILGIAEISHLADHSKVKTFFESLSQLSCRLLTTQHHD